MKPNYPYFPYPSSSSSDGEIEELLILRQIQLNNVMIAKLTRQQNRFGVPPHLWPLVSAVRSGGVDALRLALGSFSFFIFSPKSLFLCFFGC